jgi:hypothetical protein
MVGGSPASSTTKTGRHGIAEILLDGVKHQKSINLSYCSCMFPFEICSQKLEICKSVCMFIVLAIVVEID